MTRARALKQTIRARAANTGERYTTARRQVLKQLSSAKRSRTAPAAAAPKEESAPSPTGARGVPLPAAAAPAAAAAGKAAVPDAKVREKTGHGLDHWFAVLDRFGGIPHGHSALAKHLYSEHGVPGWYAQGITVAYERARGARAVNQRMSGDYEVSVTKTVGGDTRTVRKAFTDPQLRQQWLANADREVAGALAAALTDKSSKGFVIREDGLGRFRYKWGPTTVQFYLIPKGDGRTSVVVTHMRLQAAPAVEARRAQWRLVLAALADHRARSHR